MSVLFNVGNKGVDNLPFYNDRLSRSNLKWTLLHTFTKCIVDRIINQELSIITGKGNRNGRDFKYNMVVMFRDLFTIEYLTCLVLKKGSLQYLVFDLP